MNETAKNTKGISSQKITNPYVYYDRDKTKPNFAILRCIHKGTPTVANVFIQWRLVARQH